MDRGVFKGLNFFLSGGGVAQHPLRHENPLKSIDFTVPMMTIRPTKRVHPTYKLWPSDLQIVTIRQHKWWLRPLQMVTIRPVQKVFDPTCKKGSSDLLKWWPSNSSDHTKSVHPTYMYTNDDHPRPKKCASDLQMMTIRLIDLYTKSVHPTYICLLYKWWPSDLQKVCIRPTNDDHPTYKKWTSDLQLVTIQELQNV